MYRTRMFRFPLLPNLFLFLSLGICLSMLCSCGKSPSDAGQVVLYCSVDQAVAEPIVAEFEKQTGIDVLARYDTEAGKTVGLVQRIRAESGRPAADVFWSSEVFYTIRLAREGLLEPYESQATADWPEQFIGPENRWYGLALRGRVIGYNTNRVNGEEAPEKLEDVLDPKWKGRIVMATPEFGTTGGDVASWFAHYGSERATEILEGLAANDMRTVAGNSTAVRAVATGQADVCFTDTDDVYAGLRNGWPLAMNWLDQGGDGTLAIPNTVAVVKGAANSEQAGVLVDFILGGTVEKMLAESHSHNSPVDPNLARQYSEYAIEKPLKVDYSEVADELPNAIKTATEILK